MSRFAMSKFASILDLCEAAGYDAGRNKPDTENCHFGLFATPEQTRAWERGKKRGDAEREDPNPSGAAATDNRAGPTGPEGAGSASGVQGRG